ncbi:hypothetical protein [Streptomyces alkaliphilus]|uniref:hypothetical protein n=1 Tax=Streptomyces alkaliphilus TaxID=1472722 RepID=UPI00117F0B1C|nr:hypothetical protein [Streptomyces alkaliphilus]MQS08046.1 hypothetical protein [Streptomyces alkaliphilus]
MENHHPDHVEWTPRKGELVVDTRRGTTGRVMDVWNGRVWLRPAIGGREWDTRVEYLRRPDTTEALRARMAELDLHRRAGGLR